MNRKITLAIACTLITSVFIPTNVAAQERYYVIDELSITVRTGESTSHQVIRSIKSGTPLTVTQTNKDSGYSQVILNDSTEGWVLTRYLSKTPTAQHQLTAAQKKIGQLQEQLNTSQEQLKGLTGTNQALDNLQQEYNATLKRLKEISSISGNAIALDEENKKLSADIIRLETEIQSLEQQNAVLQDRSARNWFITGTFVTLIGIAIGLIAPRLRVKRKTAWNEL